MTRATELGSSRPTHHMGGGPPTFGSAFMGFSGEIEEVEEEKDDWFSNKENHHTLAGGYSNVHIFLTDKGFSSVHKWCHTEMIGVLRVIQVHECEAGGYPVITLQLIAVDPAGIEREAVFEYELPFNFVFEPDLSRTFSALGLEKGEFVGFLFDSYEDKEDFSGKMQAIQGQLRLAAANFEEYKKTITEKLQEEQQAALAEQIDCFNILSG